MKIKNVFVAAALVVGTAAITAQVVSQQPGQQPPPMTPEQQKAMEEMEAKWEAFMTPGENHKLLSFKEGRWTGTVKMWMDPAQPEPQTSVCTAEYQWILDGRYLACHVNGDFMGEAFEGHSVEGYDNIKKKFFWVWIDNMGTGIMVGDGTYDSATKTFKHTYDAPDPMQGKYIKGRSIERVIDNDHFVSEMYGPSPDGKEYKMMEIAYARAE